MTILDHQRTVSCILSGTLVHRASVPQNRAVQCRTLGTPIPFRLLADSQTRRHLSIILTLAEVELSEQRSLLRSFYIRLPHRCAGRMRLHQRVTPPEVPIEAHRGNMAEGRDSRQGPRAGDPEASSECRQIEPKHPGHHIRPHISLSPPLLRNSRIRIQCSPPSPARQN